MRFRSLFACGALACLASVGFGAIAHAEEAPASDACDISGVKLGMSAAEAIAALRAKYGATAHVEPHLFPSKSRPDNYTRTLDYSVDSASIHIEFVEHMPPNSDRREVAFDVEYKVENSTSADQADLKAAVLAKYGPPSDPGPMMHWSQCPHLEFGANLLSLVNGDYVTWEKKHPAPVPKSVLTP